MTYDITLIGNYTKDKIVTPSEVKSLMEVGLTMELMQL